MWDGILIGLFSLFAVIWYSYIVPYNVMFCVCILRHMTLLDSVQFPFAI